jgi:hypothetical protein
MANISLPPLAALDAAAAELISGAADASHERAINKALWHLQSGIEIRSTYGGFLMPSGTRAGVIHRVSTVNGCNCEAAQKGHTCWHAKALAIVEAAQTHRVALPDRLAAARRAKAEREMAELFG